MATPILEPHLGMAEDMLLAALLDLGEPSPVLADLEELAHPIALALSTAAQLP